MHRNLSSENEKGIVRDNPYNYEGRIKAVTKRIENSGAISKRNKELIFQFCDHAALQGLSQPRILFYLNRFWNLARYVSKDCDSLTRRDIELLVRRIQSNGFSPQTVSDHLVVIKKFWKWLEGNDEEYPDKVKWIKPKRHLNGRAKLPEQLLTKEDIDQLLNAAEIPRDRALISVLYETGCRVGELLGLRIRSVQFDDDGAVLHLDGKTGPRRIRIIHSIPALLNWMNAHPLKEDPAAPLWITVGRRNRFGTLSYQAVHFLLNKTALKAKVGKKCNPHIFRHSRATFLAKHLTEAQMKEYFGWTQSSGMAATYVHLSGRDVDSALLKLAGRDTPQPEMEKDRLVKYCEVCKHQNSPESKRCTQCGRPLTDEAALEDEHRRKEEIAEIVLKVMQQFGVQVSLERTPLT
jgi:site-specific recombinase XerD